MRWLIFAFFFAQAATAETACQFEKSFEDTFLDAQYRDFENPDQGRGRETQRRIMAVGVIAWAERGIRHDGNPDGVEFRHGDMLEKAVACYAWEGYCGQARNDSLLRSFNTQVRNRNWNRDQIPEYAPQDLVTWAEETLNCHNNPAPITFVAGRETNFSSSSRLSVQLEQCQQGDAHACQSAADISSIAAGPDQLMAAQLGCDLGDRNLCLSAGAMLINGGAIAPDPSLAFTLMDQSCQSGLGEACYHAGNLITRGTVPDKPLRAAFDLHARGCELVHQQACSARDTVLASMGGVASISTGTAFTLSADIEAQFDANTLEEIRWGRYDGAGYVAGNNCRNTGIDRLRSCFAAGWIAEHGLSRGHDYFGARTYYTSACNLGSDTACLRYQGLLLNGLGGPVDVYGASDYLALQCRAGDAEACDMYHFGVVVTRDAISAQRVAAALDYYTWHCGNAPKSYEACLNLAILYDHPGFSTHDEGIAKVLATEACLHGGISAACDLQSNIEFREQQRQLSYAYSQSRGGIGAFLSDLGRGISRSSEIAAGRAAMAPPTGPAVRSPATSPAITAQDWRDFNNAVRAIENTGSAYNSNCPASNPYC